jgi:hypothetical protein
MDVQELNRVLFSIEDYISKSLISNLKVKVKASICAKLLPKEFVL